LAETTDNNSRNQNQKKKKYLKIAVKKTATPGEG
jgi:hypothetical protein